MFANGHLTFLEWSTDLFLDDDQDRALHAGIAASRHAGYVLQDLLGPERGKRRHNSSSDSSLLEIPVRTRTGQAKKDNPRPAMPEPQKDKPTSRKKQKVDSSNSEVSSQTTSPTAAKETFEKRPRRKTREDRYEPKRKETHPKKTDEEMATNRKRLKRCDRGKAAKKAGEELMQNFSSKSIGRERLTVSNGNTLIQDIADPPRYALFTAQGFLLMAELHLQQDIEAVSRLMIA